MSSKLAGKRKRSSPSASALMVYRPYAKTYKRKRTSFIPGVDRTGGFYGRYSGRYGELKFHDLNIIDAVVVNTGAVTTSCNLIAQGVTESQRVGRKCTIKSINWHYEVTLPQSDAQATPGSSDMLRCIIYVDKQCNGATIAVNDLLESADFLHFRNLANSGRFQVLMDKMHVINYNGLGSDGAAVISQGNVLRHGTFYKACNIPIEFSDTTGVLTEIRSNNIGVLLISNAGVCGFNSKMRLRFSDSG